MNATAFVRATALALLVLAAGCASVTPGVAPPARKQAVFAVTESGKLITFDAATPGQISPARSLAGLDAGDALIGMDYRAGNRLYALSRGGRLFTVDVAAAALTPVGADRILFELAGDAFGFAFDTMQNRFRVVGARSQNFRVDPATGVGVDADPDQPGLQPDRRPTYDLTDVNAGTPAQVVALACAQDSPNRTTSYVIDGRLGQLATLGTREGVEMAVSPNTGRLFSVGPLGIGSLQLVSLGVTRGTREGFAAIAGLGAKESTWYRVDLATGRASSIGTIPAGERIRAIALEP